MTLEALEQAGIPLGAGTAYRLLLAEAAVEWLQGNTTLDTQNLGLLPSGAKVFLLKFVEIMGMSTGVASESIEGLSHSFDTTGKSLLIWQVAQELVGGYLKPQLKVYPGKRKW